MALPAIFDYSAVPADVATALRGQAERIRGRLTKATADMIDTGRDLLAAKAQLKHGDFTSWVESAIGIRMRAAQELMRIAEIAEGESANFALLPPYAATRLAAPSVPPTSRTAFVQRAEAGERVTVSDVDRELGRLRQERETAKKAEAEAKRTPRSKADDKRRREQAKADREAWDRKIEDEKQRRTDRAIEFAKILRGRLTADEWEQAEGLLLGQDAPHAHLIWQVMNRQFFCDPDREDYLPPAYRQYETIGTAKAADEIAQLSDRLRSAEESHDRISERAKGGALALARFLQQNLPAELHEPAAVLLIDIDGDAGIALLDPAPSIVPTPAAIEDDDLPDFSMKIGSDQD